MNLDQHTARPVAALDPTVLHTVALQIATACQCSITDTYRTSKRNRKLHGLPDSYHLNGMAAAIIPDDDRMLAKARAIAHANGLVLLDLGEYWRLEPQP